MQSVTDVIYIVIIIIVIIVSIVCYWNGMRKVGVEIETIMSKHTNEE